MKINLSYKYSDLDKCHCFGVDFENTEFRDAYCHWVWYYLGVYLGKIKSFNLYPYSQTNSPMYGKVLKTYKSSKGADEVAKLIVNRINKIANKKITEVVIGI
jgi:hypothetical protein